MTAVLQRVSAIRDASDSRLLKDVLFGAWSLFNSSISEIENAFIGLTDDEIDGLSALITDELDDRNFMRRVIPSALEENVKLAAGLVRALENLLIDSPNASFTVSDRDGLVCSFGAARGFIVPYRPVEPYVASDSTFARRPFVRRGLLKTRIFPERLPSGQAVDLQVVPPSGETERGFVAGAYFRNFELEVTQSQGAGGRKFFVSGAKCDAHMDQVSEALRSCEGQEIAALVFPELTMPPSVVDGLADMLLLRQLNDGSRVSHLPGFVVAGSWHEEGDGKRRNVAHILSANGSRFAKHTKLFNFSDPADLGVEDIVVSNEVLILVGDQTTFSVAICLDFCSDTKRNPYRHVEVDLVLVASYGGPDTLSAHQRHTQEIWNSGKVNTFLVQQADPMKRPAGSPGPLGYVLPVEESSSVKGPEVEGVFVVRPLQRSKR